MVGCFYNDSCCDFPFFVLHDERMYGDILVVVEIRILPKNRPGVGNLILINEMLVNFRDVDVFLKTLLLSCNEKVMFKSEFTMSWTAFCKIEIEDITNSVNFSNQNTKLKK